MITNFISTDKISKKSTKTKQAFKIVEFRGETFEIPKFNTVQEGLEYYLKEYNILTLAKDKSDNNIVSFFSKWDVATEYIGDISNRLTFNCEASILHKLKITEAELEDYGNVSIIESRHKMIPYLENAKENLMYGRYDKDDICGSATFLNRIKSEDNKVVFSMDYIDLFSIYNQIDVCGYFHFWDLFVNQKIWGAEFSIKRKNKMIDIDYFDTWFHLVKLITDIENEDNRGFRVNYGNSRKLREFFIYLKDKYNLKNGDTFNLSERIYISAYLFDKDFDIYDIYEYIDLYKLDLSQMISKHQVEITKKFEEDKAFEAYCRENSGSGYNSRRMNASEQKAQISVLMKHLGFSAFFGSDKVGIALSIWFVPYFYSFLNEGDDSFALDSYNGFIPEKTFIKFISNNTNADYKSIRTDRKLIDRIIDTSFEDYIVNGIKFKTTSDLLNDIQKELDGIMKHCKIKNEVDKFEQELSSNQRDSVKNNPLASNRMVDFRRPGYFNAMQGALEQHSSIYGAKISQAESKLKTANYRSYVDYMCKTSGKSFKNGLYKINY